VPVGAASAVNVALLPLQIPTVWGNGGVGGGVIVMVTGVRLLSQPFIVVCT
jgi:hypothetical protein